MQPYRPFEIYVKKNIRLIRIKQSSLDFSYASSVRFF